MQCKMLSFKPVYKIMKVLYLFSFVAVVVAVVVVALVVAVAQDQHTLTEINENAVELKVITKSKEETLCTNINQNLKSTEHKVITSETKQTDLVQEKSRITVG